MEKYTPIVNATKIKVKNEKGEELEAVPLIYATQLEESLSKSVENFENRTALAKSSLFLGIELVKELMSLCPDHEHHGEQLRMLEEEYSKL